MGKIMRFVMTLLLVSLAVGQAWAAKTIDVPSAYTAKSTAAVPVDCSYGSWGYHSQMIYPQSLLEEANLPAEAFITAITFRSIRGTMNILLSLAKNKGRRTTR